MIPDSYETFFLACSGIGGALIGLLFVAISIQPERTFNPMGDAGWLYQRLAESTLLTLTDAFLVSTVALIPGISVDWLNVILGGIGTLAALYLARQFLRLHQHNSARLAPSRDRLRVISLSVIVTTLFVVQVVVGFRLMTDPTGEMSTHSLALVIVCLYLLGIARAWILLGDPQFGWSGWLNPLRDPGGR